MQTWYRGAALAAALIGAVAFTNASRVSETAPIEGRVLDLGGDVLQYAHVRVTDEMTGATAETLTMLNGRFKMPNLVPNHTYAVDVRCIGYIPWHASGIRPTSTGAALSVVTMEPIRRLRELRVAMRSDLDPVGAGGER
jgi:hypothetical protein